jgi:hypothetical protein
VADSDIDIDIDHHDNRSRSALDHHHDVVDPDLL